MTTDRNILITSHLTAKQEQQIADLTALCRTQDSISLSYPESEDRENNYLLYASNGVLLSALAVVLLDDTSLECVAFTHPDHRNKGCFSALLSALLGTYDDYDILFPVSGSCPDTTKTLHALEAEPVSAEHQMELSLHTRPNPSSFTAMDSYQLLLTNHKDNACHFSLTDGTTMCGSCETLQLSADTICLHHVLITPSLRGKGLGHILMNHLLCALYDKGIRHILLQVSGDNVPALALYKKTGFRITETLSYYLY